MVLQPIKRASSFCGQVADVCFQRRRKPRPTVMRRVFSRVSECELPNGVVSDGFLFGSEVD